MSIQYEFYFNYNDSDNDFSDFLMALPHFDRYDNKNFAFIYRKPGKDNPEAVIELQDTGLILRDYLTGVGRELIGYLVEHITGISDNLTIEEADRYLY
jgi:hypothetical protein